MTATIHLHPSANAFGIAMAYLDRTTAPEAVRPAPRDATLSDLLADARAGLAVPEGATAAELAGHLMLLEVYGNEDERAYARDFAEDQRHRDDLALWLPVIMVPQVPKRDLLPKIAAPVPDARPGFIRDRIGDVAGLAAVCLIALGVYAL